MKNKELISQIKSRIFNVKKEEEINRDFILASIIACGKSLDREAHVGDKKE